MSWLTPGERGAEPRHNMAIPAPVAKEHEVLPLLLCTYLMTFFSGMVDGTTFISSVTNVLPTHLTGTSVKIGIYFGESRPPLPKVKGELRVLAKIQAMLSRYLRPFVNLSLHPRWWKRERKLNHCLTLCRLIQYLDSSALGLVRRWRLIGGFLSTYYCIPGWCSGEHDPGAGRAHARHARVLLRRLFSRRRGQPLQGEQELAHALMVPAGKDPPATLPASSLRKLRCQIPFRRHMREGRERPHSQIAAHVHNRRARCCVCLPLTLVRSKGRCK